MLSALASQAFKKKSKQEIFVFILTQLYCRMRLVNVPLWGTDLDLSHCFYFLFPLPGRLKQPREACFLLTQQEDLFFFSHHQSILNRCVGKPVVPVLGLPSKSPGKLKKKKNTLKSFWGPMPWNSHSVCLEWDLKIESVGDTDKQCHLETTIWKSQIVILNYLSCM